MQFWLVPLQNGMEHKNEVFDLVNLSLLVWVLYRFDDMQGCSGFGNKNIVKR